MNEDGATLEGEKFVGAYVLGKGESTVGFHFKHKPFIVHRFFMWLCLGFRWEDEKEF